MAAVLLSLSGFLIAGNHVGIVQARRTHVGFSCVPFLGGLFGSAGFLLLPRVRLFAFIPPLVDAGCVLMVLALLVHIFRRDANGSH